MPGLVLRAGIVKGVTQPNGGLVILSAEESEALIGAAEPQEESNDEA